MPPVAVETAISVQPTVGNRLAGGAAHASTIAPHSIGAIETLAAGSSMNGIDSTVLS
jgi:hypothetical protein